MSDGAKKENEEEENKEYGEEEREEEETKKKEEKKERKTMKTKKSRKRNQSYRFMGIKGHGKKQNNGDIKISSSQGLKGERLSGCEKLLSVVL